MKYILVSGGNISGLGKGTCSSSLGHLLQLRGHKVTMIKIDPYLNIDAGTMNPYEHGEVFVTDDGTETDLDIGNYERFLNIRLSSKNNITTGKIYKNVLEKEREGKYLGETVQIVPHITNEILLQIESIKGYEICIIELGGTVGDIEASVFLEALRQLQFKHKANFCHIHVTLVPIVREQKSKPTQHSFKELRETGLSPDFIFCRCEKPIEREIINKVSAFCMVPKKHVISMHNVPSIYKVPEILESQGVPKMICKQLQLKTKTEEVSPFNFICSYKHKVNIAIVGKYTKLQDSYLSLTKALFHSCNYNEVSLNIIWVDPDKNFEDIKGANGIIIPGGFGVRGTKGKMEACKYARENNVTFLGICFGFQLALIEYANNVLNLNVGTEEICETTNPLFMKKEDEKLGGTMIKGLQEIQVKQESKLSEMYRDYPKYERFRHRYILNPKYLSFFENISFPLYAKQSGYCAFEYTDKSFYIGVQYHPEFLSRLTNPHPVFNDFILSSYLDSSYV